MRETVEKSDKRPHCFELYGAGSDIIKACKVDKEGKVVEGRFETFVNTLTHKALRKQTTKLR